MRGGHFPCRADHWTMVIIADGDGNGEDNGNGDNCRTFRLLEAQLENEHMVLPCLPITFCSP